MADRGHGLEALAEDGDPSGIVESITAGSGATTPLAPGVAVVIDTGTELFVSGTADDGSGLEALAEDGDAGPYAENTGGTVFAIPAGESEPGPLYPGHTYTVEIEAEAGQNLTFATMFVQSLGSCAGAGDDVLAPNVRPLRIRWGESASPHSVRGRELVGRGGGSRILARDRAWPHLHGSGSQAAPSATGLPGRPLCDRTS
ncbi:MAG: spondin domain-containing protein, partial [Acidimicrobiia bacterium]